MIYEAFSDNYHQSIIFYNYFYPPEKFQLNLLWRAVDCKEKIPTRPQWSSQLQSEVWAAGGVCLVQQDILLQRLDYEKHEKS